MDAIGADAQIERTHAKGIHRMTTRHPARQPWVFRHHGRRRGPGRIDTLVRHAGDPLPTVLVARNGDGIADGFAGTGHEIKTTVAEADHDLTRGNALSEAHDFAAAVVDSIAAAPVPEELLRQGWRSEQRGKGREHGAHDGTEEEPNGHATVSLAIRLGARFCATPGNRRGRG